MADLIFVVVVLCGFALLRLLVAGLAALLGDAETRRERS